MPLENGYLQFQREGSNNTVARPWGGTGMVRKQEDGEQTEGTDHAFIGVSKGKAR